MLIVKKRVLSCALIINLLISLLSTAVLAAVDSQSPVIDKDSITVSAETATVGDTITVTVEITDNVSISHVHIGFWNKDTEEGNEFTMSRVGESDTYSCQFSVTEATPAETWRITRISAFDTIGNVDSMYFAYDEYTFIVGGEPAAITIKTEDVTIDKDRATVGILLRSL